MNNTQRTVDESRIQKVVDSMTTTKTSKISLNIFDDKRFYVNNIKSYPHDKEPYLFKRDLLNRIKKLYKEKDKDKDKNKDKDKDKDKVKDRDVDKMICEAGSMINYFKELTIESNRKLIEAAIILHNELL